MGVNQLITVYHFSLLREMDESRFRIPKTSDEEKTSIINSVSENEWTFGSCIQISKGLDTISKSLKIFIQYFIARDMVYKQ